MIAPKITAVDILYALRDRHPGPEWVFIPELRMGTGYSDTVGGRKILSEVEARVDGYAINTYPSQSRQRVAYEIKIGRADFRSEIRRPLKRRPALMVSNLFYFVIPEGVVTPEEIPQECGLLVVKEKLPCHTTHPIEEIVSAPWRDTGPPAWHFVAALCRRLSHGSPWDSD